MTAEEKKAQREAKKKQKQMMKQQKGQKGEETQTGEGLKPDEAPKPDVGPKPSDGTPTGKTAAKTDVSTPVQKKEATDSVCTPVGNILPSTPRQPPAPIPTQEKETEFIRRTQEESPPQSASKLNPNAAVFVPGAWSPPSKATLSESDSNTKTTTNSETAAATKTPVLKTADLSGAPALSKAELKKKRREEQEAQRAAKEAAKAEKAAAGGQKDGKAVVKEKKETKKPEQLPVERKKSTGDNAKMATTRIPDSRQADNAKKVRKLTKALERQGLTVPPSMKKSSIFDHLPLYDRTTSLTNSYLFNSNSPVHPMFLKMGLQINQGRIQGSNARCLALMIAMRQLISDYTLTPNTEMSRDLESKMKPNISFIDLCRPLSVSQGSFIKFVKSQVTQLDLLLSESQAKEQLVEKLENYVKEKIELAGDAIMSFAQDKIKDGDVVLTYSCSTVLTRILLDAKNRGVDFKVIVADGRPKNEGRELLRRLSAVGIPLTYIDINYVSYVINSVTKVFLGAAALLANGCVMNRVGSAQVALIAKTANKPVIVCCETYKFCERVQTDSIVSNELADPTPLVFPDSPLAPDWKDARRLTVLNISYDITPPNLIAVVITELGAIPCTSVPVVLRVKERQ